MLYQPSEGIFNEAGEKLNPNFGDYLLEVSGSLAAAFVKESLQKGNYISFAGENTGYYMDGRTINLTTGEITYPESKTEDISNLEP